MYVYVAIGFIVNSWSKLRIESRILNESPCICTYEELPLSLHTCHTPQRSPLNPAPLNAPTRFKRPFTVESRFKVQNVVTEMEFRVKKSRFSVKSRFKE